MNPIFKKQVDFYRSFHQDHRNIITHFIGIPLIVISILFILSTVPLFNLGNKVLSLGMIVFALASLTWLYLDLVIGLILFVIFLPFLILSESYAPGFTALTKWLIFSLLFIGGWIFQLVGHALEGKRPALVSNLFQALIGPMFLVLEVLQFFGFKKNY